MKSPSIADVSLWRGLVWLILCLAPLHVSDANLVLTSIAGNEGVSADTVNIAVNASGSGSASGGFAVTGNVSAAAARNRNFSLTLDAVGLVSASGARVTDALIDRDSVGKLGVRGGGGNGIDAFEGFLIGINATELEPGHAWQITGIRFEFVNGDESFTIVNRNDPSRRITGTSNTMFDVSNLGLWVNGGSADAEVASVFANTTALATSAFRITGFELDAVPLNAGRNAPWRSVLYPADWQPPAQRSFYHDKFIQDFSYAGYRRGETAIPRVAGPIFDVTSYGADPTGSADSTVAIRAALVAARTAGGGVVSLPPGTFKISNIGGNEILRISGNGVVLRGSGPDQTYLLNTTVAMRNLATIRIRGLNPAEGLPVPITSDITSPVQRIHLADASSFAPGDLVEVLRDFTDAWILEHGQEDYWNAGIDIPDPANYRRLVTAVNTTENWIDIDVPLRYACLTRDNARVRKLTGRISECGIEDLSIGNIQHPGTQWGETDHGVPGAAAYDVAFSWVIDVQRAINCWVSNVRSFQPEGNTSTSHNPSNGIRLGSSKNVTVRNCHFQRPQYGGGDGNGYMYRLQGADDCLVVDSIAEFNRHGFVVSHSGTTGNVFLRCEDRTTSRATGSGSGGYITGGDGSDNHMQFSHSNLWDQCRAVDSFYEAIFRVTTGHGLSTAHGVYWNTAGSGTAYPDKLVATEQGRYGYVIGTSGTVNAVTTKDPSLHHTEPADHIEGVGLGNTLFPPSLYQDQLERRIGTGISITSVKTGSGSNSVQAGMEIDETSTAANTTIEDFRISGRTTGGVAKGSAVSVIFDAVKSTSLEGTAYGQKLLAGTIDRDNAGRIGVAPGGLGSDGANREALHLVIDATALSPSSKVTIESVQVSLLGAGESCQLVDFAGNRLVAIAGSPQTLPDFDFDISSLGLAVAGGTIQTLAAIIPGPATDIRVRGVTLSITGRDGIRLTSNSPNDGAPLLEWDLGSDGSGSISSLGTDFEIDGSAELAGAGLIGVSLEAMASVDTTNDLGAKLAGGTIDRASTGAIGVSPGGINEFEGIGIAINAAAIDPRIKIRIESLTVQFVDANESFTIVNRNDVAERLTVGGNASGAEIVIGPDIFRIDVSELDLSVAGGLSGNIASLFGNDMPSGNASFRLLGLELAAIPAQPIFESFRIRHVGPSANLDWSVNPLFGTAQLYRTEKLGAPWILLGSVPGVSSYQETISPSSQSAFFRLAVPMP
ncbi:MAG: glycoside hydrolase family 55 protein [Akkermansiaceae bacterium]|nr:glycoside hydrolase family 55 protein [Akkermansiaceae bacterium]